MPLTYEDERYRDVTLTLANHQYRGRSVGSEQTCHQLPGHDVMFDVGGAPLSSTVVPNVFITHGHDDHVGGLGTHHLRRNGWGLDPARYFVQEGDADLVRSMVQAQCALNRSHALANVSIVPVGVGSEVPVGKGGLVVRPFHSTHKIPCLGYGLWGKRTRLRADLRGQPKGAILAARARGEDVNESFEVCEVAFPGDTNLNILNKDAGAVVSNARVLLLECTFIDDEVSAKDTFRTGHVHIDDFIGCARDGAFKNEVILLTHFSARYSADYIRETVTRRLKDEAIWPRVRLLIPRSA
jgi:ribonuclease Z